MILDGQVSENGCESWIVTANEQGPPVSPEQKTFVVPIGKSVPDGGLHSTTPQLPPEGVAKLTTAPHCPAVLVIVMSDGQLMSHVCGIIVAEAVKVLSVSNNSFVELETVAVLETTAPGGAPASTWKTNCNTAVVLAGRVARVQVITPSLGLEQEKAGPDV